MNAATCYERLVALVPEEQDYQLYYAQCLYQACLYQDALKVVSQIEEPMSQGKVSTVFDNNFIMLLILL